jgi:hypothetical protein
VVALCATALLVTPDACADDIDDFIFARDAYANSEYAIAVQRLRMLLDRVPPVREDLVEPARKYLFAALLLTDHTDEASALLTQMFLANPDLTFAPREFSPVVFDRVALTRERMAEQLDAIRARRRREREEAAARREAQRRELRDQLTHDTVVTPRWPMFVPFGVGQFMNGDIALGLTFAVLEAVTAAIGIGSFVYVTTLQSSACWNALTMTGRQSCVGIAQTLNYVGWATFGAAILGGIIQANVAYRPERRRPRTQPLPSGVPELSFGIAPMPGGNGVFVTGAMRF